MTRKEVEVMSLNELINNLCYIVTDIAMSMTIKKTNKRNYDIITNELMRRGICLRTDFEKLYKYATR